MATSPAPSTDPAHRSVFADPPRTKRPRPELSREIVVGAALAILDREGADQLSFRRLAADLGAGAASLYWYVPNREALLDLALDAVAAEVWAAIPARAKKATTAAGWRRDLRRVAVEMYVGLGRRPWAGRQQLVSSDRGPNQLRIWDHLGRICFRAGLGDRDAFYAMTAVLSFVLGYVSQETAPTDRDVDRESHLAAMGEHMQALDPAEFPAARRLVATFATHDQRSQFEAGLDLLLDGIEQQVTRTPSRSRTPSSGSSAR
ncbi:MAG TPA: TetR/AcrR family transcriptional regulator C-terminal domain-containing protein [Mycobacteriales bacterium]